VILLILIEIALLCVLVLLIRMAVRRGIARVFEGDDDFGDEFQPAGAGTRTNSSVEASIRAAPASEEKQRDDDAFDRRKR